MLVKFVAVISKILVALIIPLLAKSAAVILKILVILIVPLLAKPAATILALPETVSVSVALQVKSLAESS